MPGPSLSIPRAGRSAFHSPPHRLCSALGALELAVMPPWRETASDYQCVSVIACGFAPEPPLREFFSFFFTPSNNKTKYRCFSAIFRQKGAFIKIVPDIFGHFWTLIWDKWAISCSFLRQNRHFSRQSLNTHSPPLDISGHFCLFEPFCENLSRFLGQYGPSALAPPTRQSDPIFYFTPQSVPPRLQTPHLHAGLRMPFAKNHARIPSAQENEPSLCP